MFTRLPNVGVVQYNNFQLPPTFKASVPSARNVYDLANRTVKYVNYTFHFEWYVDGGDPPTYAHGAQTDTNIEKLRKCLMEPGGAFYFQSQGFGNFTVNAGGVKDVAFGPTPLDFSWKPIGSNRAGLVTWTVEVHVPECCEVTPADSGRPMEFTFEVTYNVDHMGMSVRTITGTIEIPMTRQGHSIPDIADVYRSRIVPIIPVNFRRTQQSFNVSRDKRVLSFSITDSEIPSENAYPEGITDVDVRHNISNRAMSLVDAAGWLLGGVFRAIPLVGQLASSIYIPDPRWTCSIQGTYKILAGQPQTRGWDAFWAIVKDRQSKIGLGAIFRDGALAPIGVNSWCLLQQDYSEGLYDRTVNFAVTWMMYTYTKDIMKASGMWSKVPAPFNSWSKWQSKLSEVGASSIRGVAGLQSNASDDVIVDLCLDGDPLMGGDAEAKIANFKDASPDTGSLPDPEASWLDYKIWFEFIQDQNKVKHEFYQDNPPIKVGIPPSELGKSKAVGGVSFWDSPHNNQDVIQELGAPSYHVALCGYGVRAGHPIPIPVLVSMGGKQASLLQTTPMSGIVSNAPNGSNPIPIYAASWQSIYTIEDAPANNLGAPNNYITGFGRTDAA